jgi:hypothetical protein
VISSLQSAFLYHKLRPGIHRFNSEHAQRCVTSLGAENRTISSLICVGITAVSAVKDITKLPFEGNKT